jgi:pyruvate dehydrogenase E2 component (dihydrolipoamide acetyltransferase)
MTQELTMPKLSDSMADAVIVRWLKSEGDAFSRGEALIEVETDKATVVYEAEVDGKLGAILAPEGANVAVGEPIATLANGSSPTPERREAATAAGGVADARPNATPVARRTAVELGVSLHGIAGTGQGGRVTREDVRRAAESGDVQTQAATAGKGDVRVIELTATQATVARRMVESATTIPVFTVTADVDMSLIAALRKGAREEGGDVASLNDFVVKAVALTLREFPRFNASYADGKLECYSRINVGIAVATDDALLVPVVADADRKSLAEIAAVSRRLAEAARHRALQPDELHDATFTVSNLGMFGVRSFTAIIDPPQVAILAVGGVRDEVMTVTLSCDHRVVYGADGARFLARLRDLLERPLVLVT